MHIAYSVSEFLNESGLARYEMIAVAQSFHNEWFSDICSFLMSYFTPQVL